VGSSWEWWIFSSQGGGRVYRKIEFPLPRANHGSMNHGFTHCGQRMGRGQGLVIVFPQPTNNQHPTSLPRAQHSQTATHAELACHEEAEISTANRDSDSTVLGYRARARHWAQKSTYVWATGTAFGSRDGGQDAAACGQSVQSTASRTCLYPHAGPQVTAPPGRCICPHGMLDVSLPQSSPEPSPPTNLSASQTGFVAPKWHSVE
jgi:hypothetical protein